MKKAVSTVLILVLVFMLCSCGSTASSSAENSTANSKDIDFSLYTREELLEMRNAINAILDEGESVNADSSSASESTSSGTSLGTTDVQIPTVPSGDESPASDFIWASNGSEVQINGYAGPGGVIIIPSEIDGLPVTRIAQKAFYDVDNMTGLVLPDTLKVIGDYAFGGVHWTDAGVLVLPSSLTEVGGHAFAYSGFSGIVIKCNCVFTCTFEQMHNLQFIYIEEGAKPVLRTRAFGYGEVLTTAIIPSSVTDFKTDDIFKGSNTVTIYTPEGSAAAKYGTTSFISVNTKDYDAMVAQYSVY